MPEPSGLILGERRWSLVDLPAAHVFDAKTFEAIEFVSYLDLAKGVVGRIRLKPDGQPMRHVNGEVVRIFETRSVLVEFVEDPPAPLTRTMWAPMGESP